MGRANNRARILAAVVSVIERDGIGGVTLEAVAAEATLTKGGLQYHFVSKDELMEAVERETWERADDAALRALGKEFEDSTPDERLEALIRSFALGEVRKADLHLALNASVSGHTSDLRDEFMDKWTGVRLRPLSAWQWTALLASDGLWTHDALDGACSNDRREEAIHVMLEMIRR